jgi:hypothetical protein
MARMRIAVALRGRNKRTLNQELEQLLLIEAGRRIHPRSFGQVPGGDGVAKRVIRYLKRSANHEERVLVVFSGIAMHRVSRIPVQVVALGSWDEKSIEAARLDDGAHRMHSGASIGSHGSKKCEPDPELIEEGAPN